jgi:protein SCO1
MHLIKAAGRPSSRKLPVLGTVPDFSFTAETGLPVQKGGLTGKIWIADFVFTRCAGPCPTMSEIMRQLQVATRSLAGGDVRLISITVDPAHDTPRVLASYGAKYGSNPDRWSFLTGEPSAVENFITKGMFLGLSKDGDGVPVHSQKFVVVDREGYIRAYHDLAPAEKLIPQIVDDIGALDRESHTPLPKKNTAK